MEESQGAGWGFYAAAQLPGVMVWLESGSDAEQELADRIHETFKAHLQPDDDGVQASLSTMRLGSIHETFKAQLQPDNDGLQASLSTMRLGASGCIAG